MSGGRRCRWGYMANRVAQHFGQEGPKLVERVHPFRMITDEVAYSISIARLGIDSAGQAHTLRYGQHFIPVEPLRQPTQQFVRLSEICCRSV